MVDPKSHWQSQRFKSRLRRRNRFERQFRYLGIAAIALAGLSLSVLLVSVLANGLGATYRTEIALDIEFDPEILGIEVPGAGETAEITASADFRAVLRTSLMQRFPDAEGRSEVRELVALLSRGAAAELADRLVEDPALLGQRIEAWIPASDDVNFWLKSEAGDSGSNSRLSERQVAWIEALAADDRVARRFNGRFFSSGDSREPELAGIGGALIGSALTLLVTLAVSFPLGVAAAVYLEEFAPDNRWTRQLEININNLAAVPSIVFGLLGLAVFLGLFGMPRSAPVVGGLTLALMTLPVIIIASRASIAAVPFWIRESARGLGASPVQVVAHQVLPIAMPGIVTGTLLGLARAMGETAPLLMIGMVAFIVDVPTNFTDAASALPVQIFLWADSPERGFVEKVSGAILVLLALLGILNGAAILLRQKFEQHW
ncbi:MAG: phosphate ABC transporter permease PstA [Deltaproteobacteria bacterium]|jgi:phosphate transport system permease protein|nr:phosphate ABC transporter permease PstA [Deltaproteobacteria bacterium]